MSFVLKIVSFVQRVLKRSYRCDKRLLNRNRGMVAIVYEKNIPELLIKWMEKYEPFQSEELV